MNSVIKVYITFLTVALLKLINIAQLHGPPVYILLWTIGMLEYIRGLLGLGLRHSPLVLGLIRDKGRSGYAASLGPIGP